MYMYGWVNFDIYSSCNKHKEKGTDLKSLHYLVLTTQTFKLILYIFS